MIQLPVDPIRVSVNADPEWKLAARYWNAAIRLDAGDRCYSLRVDDGRLTAFRPADPFDSCTIEISANAEVWREMLQAMPRPFYQCFFAAQLGGTGLRMSGDMESIYAHYGALARLLAIMRTHLNPH